MTPTEKAEELMRPADKFACTHAKLRLEATYGTSASYTAQCRTEATEARSTLRAAIEQALREASAVPDGYVLVPKKPTMAMLNTWAHRWPIAYYGDQRCTEKILGWGQVNDIWNDMLAAAPAQPAAEPAAGVILDLPDEPLPGVPMSAYNQPGQVRVTGVNDPSIKSIALWAEPGSAKVEGE